MLKAKFDPEVKLVHVDVTGPESGGIYAMRNIERDADNDVIRDVERGVVGFNGYLSPEGSQFMIMLHKVDGVHMVGSEVKEIKGDR